MNNTFDAAQNSTSQPIIASVEQWVNSFVVGMNLCPFAKRELVKNKVRFTETPATSQEELLEALKTELERLNKVPSIETTLLIHPHVLLDFYEYNQFLDQADNLLKHLELEGIYQIASFHPNYQFGGTQPDDAENYTNRSPYPLMHLIREESLERAIENYPDVDDIPERNIELMNNLGKIKLESLWHSCFVTP